MTGDEIEGRPYARLPKETTKAYAAFAAYLELGLARSIVKAMDAVGAAPSKHRHWQRWSSKYHWVERVTAYDADLLYDKIAGRKTEQERVRQVAIDAAPEIMGELRDLSRGHMDPGQCVPKLTREGKPLMVPGEDGELVAVTVPVVDPKTRAKILMDILGIGGLQNPVRTIIEGPDGDGLPIREAVRSWDTDTLTIMIKALGLDL